MASHASAYRPVRSALVEQRANPRHPVLITRAIVGKRDEPPAEATVIDLSIYGCRITQSIDTAPGERLWLRFDGASPIAATVVGCQGSQIGCRFDTTLDKHLFRALTLIVD